MTSQGPNKLADKKTGAPLVDAPAAAEGNAGCLFYFRKLMSTLTNPQRVSSGYWAKETIIVPG